MTVDKIKELDGIELLSHPSYNPDMAHFPRDRQFQDVEDVEIRVQVFIDLKRKEWFRQGLDELAKQWLQIIDHDDLYFDY